MEVFIVVHEDVNLPNRLPSIAEDCFMTREAALEWAESLAKQYVNAIGTDSHKAEYHYKFEWAVWRSTTPLGWFGYRSWTSIRTYRIRTLKLHGSVLEAIAIAETKPKTAWERFKGFFSW